MIDEEVGILNITGVRDRQLVVQPPFPMRIAVSSQFMEEWADDDARLTFLAPNGDDVGYDLSEVQTLYRVCIYERARIDA